MQRSPLRLLNFQVAIGFLLATVFWMMVVVWQSAYAPTEMERQKCQETAEKAGRNGAECRTLWEKTTTDPVAFFTLWLMIFTGGLTVSTILLWNSSERQLGHLRETSERELRAYVYVEETDLKLEENGTWSHSFRIKNFGKTPAHRVRVVYRVEAVPWNDGKPRLSDPSEEEVMGSVAPNGDFVEFDSEVYAEGGIKDVVKIDDDANDARAIYFFGKITYLTVFSAEERVTEFRYYRGGDVDYQPGEMSADMTGSAT